MQKIGWLIIFFLFQLFYSLSTKGQDVNQHLSDSTNIWNQSDKFLAHLPTLETFIDSALVRDPSLKMNELNVKKRDLEITKAKRNWTKDIISGNADVNYGRFDNLILSKDLGIDQLNTSGGAQTRYSVGLNLKIPITPFFDKTEVKMARFNSEQSAIEKQILVKSIREDVYNLYNKLIESYQKYKILAGDFETYTIIMQQSEKNFAQNQTNIVDVLNSKMSNSKAMLELITAKNNFEKAIWDIQELTGIRIQF
jgi:outer membrane protein TolC